MSEASDRDAEIAHLLRREIDKLKAHAARCGWQPGTHAWHRAFGELSGLHRALEFIDPDANNVRPFLPQ